MMEFQTELDAYWHMPDQLWQQIHPLLLKDSPPKRTGRKRSDWRRMIDGIVFRVQTGCKWNKLPKQFGDDSTVHRWYQRWCKSGVMPQIWAMLVETCPELASLDPQWPIPIPGDSATGQLTVAASAGAPVEAGAPIEILHATELTPVIPAAASIAPAIPSPDQIEVGSEAASISTDSALDRYASTSEEQSPQQLPQIAAETRTDEDLSSKQIAAGDDQQIEPFSTDDTHRRAA